jgi:hypothetical protein
MEESSLTVSIDTEEDNWGCYQASGATTRNIEHLRELQDVLARWGARPTYLVNRPPLLSAPAVRVLGELAQRPDVEIGGHCHPWNTPPSTDEGAESSMMCGLPLETNRAKVAEVTRLIRQELGVTPCTFRAGRWGFGPTVSEALASQGYIVDASVTPFLDWSAEGGPDYSEIPCRPYRFDPTRPFHPDSGGSMVEIPTTVAFLRGNQRILPLVRRLLERSRWRRLRIIGILDGIGLLRRRWLSPEVTRAQDLVQLAAACQRSGLPVLDLTFHSCTLLPGATPFVRTADDRKRFLAAIELLLRFCSESRMAFRTLGEVGRSVLAAAQK